MNLSRRGFLGLGGALIAAGLSGGALSACSSESSSSSSEGNVATEASIDIDSAKWSYDSDNDVYYQIGISYCTAPVATDYESMGIYVPGAYFTAKDNGDGTYTCTVNKKKSVNGFTAKTAPIVMPINTAGYTAQAAPTSYSYDGLSDYLKAGFVYVFAGCRGRENGTDSNGNFLYSGGAPWGVTDLKSAVRCLRYNASKLPGDMDAIFSLGMSGGGAQSALLGATGDADGYVQYLEKIGAPLKDASGKTISDAIYGSMCWCPITSLDYASEAYEWNMGQFSTGDTRADGTFTKAMSDDMAEAWAIYLNKLGLKDSDGTKLKLEKSSDGIYLAGSYYDYVVGVIEDSLNNFLKDTDFPYTPSNETRADMGAGGGGQMGAGSASASSSDGQQQSAPQGTPPSGDSTSGQQQGTPPSGDSSQGAPAGGGASQDSSSSSSTTYKTAKAYIKALNGDDAWIEYDADKNTAKVKSLSGFIKACKTPSKSVGAFDGFDRGEGENQLFGNDDNDSLHFDYTMKQLLSENADEYSALSNWNSSYPSDFANDVELEDDLGNPSQVRQDLYNPMYYLVDGFYDGAGTSTPSKHWRIRTGINQGDTANTTEINLALALDMCDDVDDVDFETVWGQGHTTAERTGDSTTNFISWVEKCCK